MGLRKIQASKLKSRMLRADVYECFITGKSIVEASKELDITHESIAEYYIQFSMVIDRENPDKTMRINQARTMEAEFFRLVALKINLPRINELAFLIPKFCA